tara:strand:- start:179 stop:373 length:195 start_codon:yes stop_codon:yes gene_type:complete
MSKIDSMEEQIFEMHNRIISLKEHINPNYVEECPDEIESEKAVVDAIGDLYATELLGRKPEGDA